VLVVDPPRAGLEKDALAAAAAAGFARILYVSCAPDTLARDLACLREAGYAPVRAALFDMFPRTACFETLAVLERG
jgi:23S rRNA (uracil1939-C5)-methyltransferase